MEFSFGRVINSVRVVLESNWDTGRLFKENEPNSFITKFFSPLKFDGQWEVAIMEISYPLYIQNIPNKLDMVVGEWGDAGPDIGQILDTKKFAKKYEVSIDAGYYASPGELGETLCKLLLQAKRDKNENPVEQKLFFEHDYRKQRSRFYSKGPGTYIMSEIPDFFKHLGFMTLFVRSTDVKETVNEATGKRDIKEKTYHVEEIGKNAQDTAILPPSLEVYHMMKIYIDCIEDTIVGNMLTHEIATVTVSPGKTGQFEYVFSNPNFVPLSKNVIETVKMECRDTYGKLFPLNGGHVHASFLFRRCQLAI